MSLIGGLLGNYQPTGAYSFELYKRNANTRQLVEPMLVESFFLLPPDEYSMEEGYKMNITKTIAGAWIDDFGNDLKKITLTGSLYSFYFGSPATAAKQTGSFLGDYAADALNNVKEIGKKAVEAVPFLPGLTGIYGIDEFFKLRYIINRFRERKAASKYVGIRWDLSFTEKQLMKKFPALSQFITLKAQPTYDNFGFVFNDYDDGNHFEVVFNNFKATRNKADPFTINYIIEMTTLREKSGAIKFVGPLGANVKETYNLILKNLKDTFDLVLGEIKEITDIPDSIAESYNSFVGFLDTLDILWGDFLGKSRDDFPALVSTATEAKELTDALIQDWVSAVMQVSMADIEDETAELAVEMLEQYNLLKQMKSTLVGIQGLSVYSGNTEKVKVFDGEESELNTSDIPIEVEETDDNRTSEKEILFYVVKQGENLTKLSNLFYGDYTKENIIGEVNDLKTSDFYNDAMVGETIKIPLLESISLTGSQGNLVYSKITARSIIRER